VLRRARFWILAAFLALVAMATTSYTPAMTLHLVDQQGVPAADAYLDYSYYGHLINLVHPVTYVARGSVVTRADAEGRVTVGGRVHFRRPFPLSTPPALFIHHAYVPRLHNAFGPITAQTVARAGVFRIERQPDRVIVFDVSQDPVLWEQSLRHLFDLIRGSFTEPGSWGSALSGHVETKAHTRELIVHLRREYAALLARYADALRRRPEVSPSAFGSEEEKRAWLEQADASLAREPRWGPYLERTWRSSLKELDQWAR
jgi:hypothetical protein